MQEGSGPLPNERALVFFKSEIRNPKSEANPKSQKSNAQNHSNRERSVIAYLNLKFVSDFAFRI